jgi:2-iminobutanoate/2-iminopropanoate deaminase
MSDDRTVISTAEAPAAMGPYNQAIVANGLVFAAGQTPIDPATGQLVDGDISVQTHRVLDNLSAVLAAAGSSFERACHVRVFLRSMDDFAAMNAVYRERVREPHPARTTVAVAGLPADALVEIDVIALAG